MILVVVVVEEVRDDAKNYDNDACNEVERADETVTAKSALRRFYTRPRIKNWKLRLTKKKIQKIAREIRWEADAKVEALAELEHDIHVPEREREREAWIKRQRREQEKQSE